MSERAFLDFYDTLSSVPVNQLGAGSALHFKQRTALYRSLGITPLMVNNRDILEIGPGSGDNALHLASWQPKSFTFIDGAKAAVDTLAKKIATGSYGENAQVHYQDVAKSKVNGRYDVIICEGLIPGQHQPAAFLNNVLNALVQGGAAVFTTVSAVSYLAEICRRLLLPLVAKLADNEQDLLVKLTQLFAPSLNSLVGMTRKPEDWVLDNIIHSWTARGLFAIDDALAALPENFSVLGSSPAFLQDWRWYKNSAGENVSSYLASYQQWSSYLLDYRVTGQAAFTLSDSTKIEQLAVILMQLHDKFRDTNDEQYLQKFLLNLDVLSGLIACHMPVTVLAISDFNKGLQELMQGDLNADFGTFHQWFGRGQQYLSVINEG